MRYAKKQANGAIQFVMDTASAPPEDAGFIEVAGDVTPQTHWIEGGHAVRYKTNNYAAMPLYECSWNPETEEWLDARDVSTLKSAKSAAIEAERDRRISAPIEYLERLVDADARAQGNITDKINEINAREQIGSPMPVATMIWRDAENTNVTFESQDAMKAWLQGLVIAITQRGTEAYAWSWEVKNQLRSLDSKEEVEAFSW